MLIGCKNIAFYTFGVEQIDVSVLHPDYEIHIEKRFCMFVSGGIFYGVMLFAFIPVLIPPVYVLAVLLQELYKIFFLIRCPIELPK